MKPRADEEHYRLPAGSGHEVGLAATVAAAAPGACMIERHITFDRTRGGSDRAVSVELQSFSRMVRAIDAAEKALGDGVKHVYDSELPIRQKLRRV
jgi:N-acetylneuraminate synthase